MAGLLLYKSVKCQIMVMFMLNRASCWALGTVIGKKLISNTPLLIYVSSVCKSACECQMYQEV